MVGIWVAWPPGDLVPFEDMPRLPVFPCSPRCPALKLSRTSGPTMLSHGMETESRSVLSPTRCLCSVHEVIGAAFVVSLSRKLIENAPTVYELLLLVPAIRIIHRIIPQPKNGACQHGVPGLNQIREALLIIHYDISYIILLFIISRVYIINLSFR